jgi:hypothetical protein
LSHTIIIKISHDYLLIHPFPERWYFFHLKLAYKLQGILLLLNNKETNYTALSSIGSTPQTLVNRVHKLNKGEGVNIEVLRKKAKVGRSARLSKDNLNIIKDALRKKPRAVWS